jgi:hypothetical protein
VSLCCVFLRNHLPTVLSQTLFVCFFFFLTFCFVLFLFCWSSYHFSSQLLLIAIVLAFFSIAACQPAEKFFPEAFFPRASHLFCDEQLEESDVESSNNDDDNANCEEDFGPDSERVVLDLL